MKKIFYLSVILFLFASCEKNEVAVDEGNESSKLKIEDYLNDAKYLHIREINANSNHPNYKNITLDSAEINKIYGFIKAVYELKIPECDTIFNIHKIHTYGTIQLSEVTISVLDNGLGMQNLMNGVFPTGNTALDSLLSKYNFVKDRVYTITQPNGSHFVNLKTNMELNIEAVENKLGKIEGVFYPVPFGGIGDGNLISLSYKGNKAILDFSYGFGDCPSGCISRTNWIFEIENNKATFIQRKS